MAFGWQQEAEPRIDPAATSRNELEIEPTPARVTNADLEVLRKYAKVPGENHA